jgi:mannose-6-phosphate isomerase-like protein (cupin superfamily)
MPAHLAFELSELAARRAAANCSYMEFLRRDSLSAGLYVLPRGGTDPQQPHGEDEVYYVVSGRARFRAGAEDRAVSAGATLFVAAGLEHRFHSIEEDLTVLVFFAPAEGTAAARAR